MNVDLKLGCYYTLSVSFGMTEIKVQDWTLDELNNLEDVKRIKNHLTELPYQSFVRKN